MIGREVTFDGVAVRDVLVEPGQSRDALDVSVPAGARVDYTLRMRCDADAPQHGAKAMIDGVELDVLNVPAHWRPGDVFGTWSNPYDMTVLVGRTLGDYSATVRIVAVSATVDAVGDPVESESAVYEGPAQARMSEGSDGSGSDALSAPKETWFFVVPWAPAFGSLRPSSTYVDYGGARYDVVSIANVDMKSESASFEAVRRG